MVLVLEPDGSATHYPVVQRGALTPRPHLRPLQLVEAGFCTSSSFQVFR